MLAKGVLIVGLGVAAAGLAREVVPVEAAQAAPAGFYTAAQAAHGKELYKAKMCGLCHSDDLSGMGQNPPLATDDFTSKWDGLAMDALVDKIQKTMPATAPGSLSAQDTADITAYILEVNQFPVGATPLPSDDASLKKIAFSKPKKS